MYKKSLFRNFDDNDSDDGGDVLMDDNNADSILDSDNTYNSLSVANQNFLNMLGSSNQPRPQISLNLPSRTSKKNKNAKFGSPDKSEEKPLVFVQQATHFQSVSVDDLTSPKTNKKSYQAPRIVNFSDLDRSKPSSQSSDDRDSHSGGGEDDDGSNDSNNNDNRTDNMMICESEEHQRHPSTIGGNDDPYNAPNIEHLSQAEIEKIMGEDQGPLNCFSCRHVGEKHYSIEGLILEKFIEFLTNITTSSLVQHCVNCSHFYTVAIQRPANESLKKMKNTKFKPLPPWNPNTIKNHLLYHSADPGLFQLLFAAKAKSFTLMAMEQFVLKQKISCTVTIPYCHKQEKSNTSPEQRSLQTKFILPAGVNLANLILSELYNTDNMVVVSPNLFKDVNPTLDIDFSKITGMDILHLCEGVLEIHKEVSMSHDVIKTIKDLMAIYLPFTKADTTKMLPSVERDKPKLAAKIGPVDFERKKVTFGFEWEGFFLEKQTEDSLDIGSSSGHRNGMLGNNNHKHLTGNNSVNQSSDQKNQKRKSVGGFNTPLNGGPTQKRPNIGF